MQLDTIPRKLESLTFTNRTHEWFTVVSTVVGAADSAVRAATGQGLAGWAVDGVQAAADYVGF
ncbi:hypothetical protein VB773_11000 [Haloarculaceae archaeon H-GB2-1]|nr:hypothetical protein [Haloarculaceae archaeon H-GB1-1]MEA5386519.1 hypothetical protein [Haloarculaceae archaeon H-GB11]MEA5408033.1 hypothetical protein [Haloarculaceae archaeon H-GB2-1]